MMVAAMHERNYLHANDIYLRLAIGNSPWPIGVTSVGIHERSAREKVKAFQEDLSLATSCPFSPLDLMAGCLSP